MQPHSITLEPMAPAPYHPISLDEAELAAWRGMLRTHADVVARLDAELIRSHDLPLVAYDVLISLYAAPDGELRMGPLADDLLLSRSGLTRLIDRLSREDLVSRRRCEDDARGWFAVITRAGRRKLEAARPAHLAGVRRHFLAPLNGTDLEALARIWRKIGEAGETD